MSNNLKQEKSIIGLYGPWAASLISDPPTLSFRNKKWNHLNTWKPKAVAQTKACISAPIEDHITPKVILKNQYAFDGLHIEELEWQLPYGRKTKATLLKPLNYEGVLPGIIGMHDHSANKYFGKEKIIKTSNNQHPIIQDLQKETYAGNAWANDLAKRGYVVLVHDVFTFGSRRVKYNDLSEINWGHCMIDEKSDENPNRTENIKTYNTWAGEHEHFIAKSLFSAGTTWPGVTFYEDTIALDILSNRPDVDKNNIGCAGLSGGGLRTNFLSGIDQRIKCAISIGFNTTWKDLVNKHAYDHTWMTFVPLLPKYIDFPEIIGLRVPLPTMVMFDNDDPLYELDGMKKANTILNEVFKKAGAEDKYAGKFYPGGHKFDAQMQSDAFDWFDKWLK